jgi:predicted ATPase
VLTRLHLENFKSWTDTQEIPLKKITAFFGTNSSGKTSLLQSLLLMKQTTESSDRKRILDLGNPNSYVDLGTLGDLVFDHDLEKSLTIGLSWKSDTAVEAYDSLKRAQKKSSVIVASNDISFETVVDFDGKDPFINRFAYSLGNESVSFRKFEGRDRYELSASTYDFVRTTGRVWELPSPVKFYGFPEQTYSYYQNAAFLAELVLNFESELKRIHYLGPLRDDPRRQYIYSGGEPASVGKRGELAIDVLVASRQRKLRRSRGWAGSTKSRLLNSISIEELVASWLKELGLIVDFKLESLDDRETLYRVAVSRSSKSTQVLLTDVGFGISQILPVLVLLAYANDGDTVILEQPEIHLHPAIQSALADIIIETACVRNVQVIVESHSEHLLSRLQRRVAEGKLARGIELKMDDVALYFCSFRNDRSHLVPLQLDLFGAISNWPRDFFGNPLEDAVARLEAAELRSSEEMDCKES